MEIKLTTRQIASYLSVLSQMFFTIAVSYAYLYSDRNLDFRIMVLGFFLLAISFSTLVLGGEYTTKPL